MRARVNDALNGTSPRRRMSRGLAIGALLALTACSAEKPQQKRAPPLVDAAPVIRHAFIDRIEAVGTARANEQVTIAAAVTERVERIYFDDGMAVGRGQLLATLTQGQEQASLSGALASEKEAQSQLQRVTTLYNKGFATRTLLDAQVAAAQEARARAAEARAAIGDRVIRAPFAGFVSLRTISAGAIVTAGTPLVTISDISRIKLDFTIPETQLAAIHTGQPIEAIAAAFPDKPFIGTISTIDPVIDPATRAVLVRAVLANPGRLIKPGMLMTVRVATATRTADAVPELAVLGEGDKRFVYIVGKDHKAERITVTPGLRDKGVVEVSGIPQGARVITDGVVKVTEGAVVRLPGENPKVSGTPAK